MSTPTKRRESEVSARAILFAEYGQFECKFCGGRFKTEERADEHIKIDHDIDNQTKLNAALTELNGGYVIKKVDIQGGNVNGF